MEFAENVDRYLQEIKAMQYAEWAVREANACKVANQMEAEKARNYELVKKERDEAIARNNGTEAAARGLLSYILQNIEKPPTAGEIIFLNSIGCQDLREKIKTTLDKIADKQVQTILKNELNDTFQKECYKIAEEIIASFEAGSHSIEIEDKIKQIRDRCSVNTYAALRGPWKIRCPNCGELHFYELDDDQIQTLVLKSILRPKCVHHGLIFANNYLADNNIYGYVELTLRGVIRMYLMAS
jgi:hypothetical protein